MRLLFFLNLYLVSMFTPVSWGFINIESLRQKSETGFHGSSGVKSSGSTGNTDVMRASLNSQNVFKNLREEYIAVFDYTYGEALSETNKNQGKAHLRYAKRMGKSRFFTEAFAQAEFNEFQALELRQVFGAGTRVKVFNQSGLFVFWGVGGFYEKETLKIPPDQETVRANSYLSLRFDFSEQFSSFVIGYYQPNLREFTDFRLRGNVGFEFQATGSLSFVAEYNWAEDTLPPESIKPIDTSYMSGVQIKY